MRETEIVELKGTHESRSVDTALAELSGYGIRIIEIREATQCDIRLNRLKNLRDKMSPSMPIYNEIHIHKKLKWWQRLLNCVFKLND